MTNMLRKRSRPCLRDSTNSASKLFVKFFPGREGTFTRGFSLSSSSLKYSNSLYLYRSRKANRPKGGKKGRERQGNKVKLIEKKKKKNYPANTGFLLLEGGNIGLQGKTKDVGGREGH